MTPVRCAEMLMGSGNVVALTGAGISTAAGIPDFRGPHGLYVTRQYDPETVFDIGAFVADPAPFYEFTRDFLGVVDDLEPTFSHRFLASLEEAGILRCTVTQNIDFLHQRAGSQSVISVHGDYWTSRCLDCNVGLSLDELKLKVDAEPVPRCDSCGGLIKPDVVFFGEAVKGMDRAAAAVAEADMLLVLGSSLTVYPAASLPGLARCPVVVVNRGEVGLQPAPNRFFVDADLDAFLGEVAEIMGP